MAKCWEGKKYKLEKSENFDDYMKELGVGLVLRKMGNTISPTVELKKNEEDLYTLTTTSTFKTTVITFKLEEEFDEETLDGRKVKSVCTMKDDILTQEQKGDKPSTIIREFTDDMMKTILTVGDVKSVRVYKAVQ